MIAVRKQNLFMTTYCTQKRFIVEELTKTLEKLAMKLFSSSRKLSLPSRVVSINQTTCFRDKRAHAKYGRGKGEEKYVSFASLLRVRVSSVNNVRK